jgi:glutathione peroxidase
MIKLSTMKTILTLLLFFTLACGVPTTHSRPNNASMVNSETSTSFYDFKMKSLDGKEISFEQFKGKKVLIVNVASKCGLTPQYKDLQKLHEQHGDKVIILGFPANNFMGQEPGTSQEIAEFCQKNYGVSFQMFEKISVKGSDQHPLYQWLTKKELNGWNEATPDWNFAKYLVNEKGELVKFFSARTQPLSEEILNAIKG